MTRFIVLILRYFTRTKTCFCDILASNSLLSLQIKFISSYQLRSISCAVSYPSLKTRLNKCIQQSLSILQINILIIWRQFSKLLWKIIFKQEIVFRIWNVSSTKQMQVEWHCLTFIQPYGAKFLIALSKQTV